MFEVGSKYEFSVFGEARIGAGSVEDVDGFSFSGLHFLCYFRGRRQRLKKKE
jgi:hypothetical protein